MRDEFATARITAGNLDTLVEILMHQMGITDPEEAVGRMLSGKWAVREEGYRWLERDGVIYFKVTSDGTTGEKWIDYLGDRGLQVSGDAESILLSEGFQATSGVTYNVVVYRGVCFRDDVRVSSNIRAVAGELQLCAPPLEAACCIRRFLSDHELQLLGLCNIVTMHEPIVSDDGRQLCLSVRQKDCAGCGLDTLLNQQRPWPVGIGFAFVDSRTSEE